MVSLHELFQKVRTRRFAVEDAKELIKSSFYFGGAHPDVHIHLSVLRPPDFHFQHLPQYEDRDVHSMFPSFEVAASAVAASLNCAAGAAAARFLSVSGVDRVALYSRSGGQAAPNTIARTAIGVQGVRTGTMYGSHTTLIVVLVLIIRNGQVVLLTAYPTHGIGNRPVPADGFDMLEYGNQRFTYPSAGALP
jgi:hypothetical protein